MPEDLVGGLVFLASDESDMMTSLVNFFTIGEVREYLLSAIADARKGSASWKGLKVPRRLKSWLRVPSSTWFISGATILISVIGFLFMRGRENKKDEFGGDEA